MAKKKVTLKDMSKGAEEQLIDIIGDEIMDLPYPYNEPFSCPPIRPLTEEQRNTYECSLDGIPVVAIPKAKTEAEKQEIVDKFLSGLGKLLSKDDNWTFYQQLVLTLEACTKCQTCSEACPIYISSGKQEIYRPTYRADVVRKIKEKYLDKGGKVMSKLRGNDIELNYELVVRLAELSYRCTMCRRCAKWCPIGSDNALVTHELRKLFAQEMGLAAKEIHQLGSVQQLKVGSSTGMTPAALKDIIDFMEEEIEEKAGRKIKIPVDKKGAEILLLHNAGEFLSWPENPEAFAILFDAAGVDYTLSSEAIGYDSVNYGVWYSDAQYARVLVNHVRIAKELGVKKIVVAECGHAHKATIVISDRVLTGEMNIPRESCFPMMEEIVFSGKIKLDPQKNNFPVTLHDPCNFVRLMGIVEPQRKMLKYLCPQFREMTPHGVDNYCCGGGSGFAIMQGLNFPDWKMTISGRMKMKQVVDAFQDVISPDIKKLVCTPCSNCKGQFRDLLKYYELGPKAGIGYTGLVEFIVNAMVDMKEPFLDLEELTA
jgi:Fe-S oxidoreductase